MHWHGTTARHSMQVPVPAYAVDQRPLFRHGV